MNLIAFTGKMGSGKTTAVQIVKRMMDCEVVKFAGAIYDIQHYIYERSRLEQPQPKDRKLLQWLGTEWGRSRDENLWVNIWRADAKMAALGGFTVLCDDLRFPNEARAVKELGGSIIEIVASAESRGQRIELIETGHASELGVPAADVDFFVENNGSLADFQRQIEGAVLAHNARRIA